MDTRGYILNLGLVDYKKAWDLQHDLWSKRVEGALPDLLLLLEHPHVITLGRRGNRSHLIVSPEVLEAMKIPIFHVERGGDITYHGFGQMMAYPILDLKDYGYRLIRYISQLEEVILHVLRDFGIEGRRDPSNRGVWVDQDKIASIGVAIKRWVSFHGFALNYETDLKYFDLINPCGLVGQKMTTMSKILGTKVPREGLAERIKVHFGEIFKRNWIEKELKDLIEQ
ncbi:MAG: lipoyl(octanoyl) transferase LipB [Thermodesulfobacteriota bacterium]